MEQYKEIRSWQYDPTSSIFKHKASERGSFSILYCKCPDKCEAYAKGQCVMLHGDWCCPSGRISREISPTPRARGYGRFFLERSAAHKDTFRAKLEKVECISYIGAEFVYLPISHLGLMTECEDLKHIDLKAGGGFFSSSKPVIHRNDFTPENIILMLRMRPRTLFDHRVITDYQNESIPKFVQQLKECDRDLYAKVVELMTDEEKSRLVNITNVGRTAILETLTPNVGKFVDIHGGEWGWDDEWLTSRNSRASFLLVSSFSEIRVKPDPKSKVKVTDDGQVNEHTVFID